MILGAIFAASLLYFYAHHVGYVKRDEEMQLEIARLNGEAREKEQKLAEDLNQTSSQLREANDVVSKKQSDLDRLINSGRVRLNSSCVQTATDSTPATRDRDEARDKLERETIKAIIAIAADGDRNTAQLNSCIDTFNEVREKINGQR